MSSDPYYEVYAGRPNRDAYGPYTADCFTHAERRARWYAARSGHRYYIERVIPRVPTHNEREVVATVIRDNDGRIWTDVQTMDGLI